SMPRPVAYNKVVRSVLRFAYTFAAAAVLVLLSGFCSSSFAQQPVPPLSTPSLRITATDAQHLAIPRATCTAIPAAAHGGTTAVSDDQGTCVFTSLSRGTYVVRVELDGFETFTQANVVVGDQIADVAAVLTLARVAQTVTVKGADRTDASVAAGSAPAA